MRFRANLAVSEDGRRRTLWVFDPRRSGCGSLLVAELEAIRQSAEKPDA
jgi:hypothetical protein